MSVTQYFFQLEASVYLLHPFIWEE